MSSQILFSAAVQDHIFIGFTVSRRFWLSLSSDLKRLPEDQEGEQNFQLNNIREW